MKIAQIAPAIEQVPPAKYGGTELVISNLTEGLVAKGHEVHLFASGDSTTSAQLHPITEKAIRTNCTPEEYKVMRDVYMHLGMEEILNSLMAEEFDIVHNHIGWRLLPYEGIIKPPIVSTLHGHMEGEFNEKIFGHFKRSNFVSISDSQRLPFPELNYLKTVYNGIDVSQFAYNEHPKGGYLAFLGRMSPLKGPKEAIMVAKQAGLPLKMAAKVDPVDQEYFDAEIGPLIDGKQIQFIGEVDHAGKVALLSDAVAMLAMIQWEEPFGLFVVESLACGTPVIAIPRGALPELMEDGVNGIFVKSVEEGAEAVKRVGSIDRAACRKRSELFSIGRMVEGYEDLYRQVVSQERAVPPPFALPGFMSLSDQLLRQN